MHTVDTNNVVEKSESGFNKIDANASYTSILNSAIFSTKKRNKIRDSINRFFYSVGPFNFLIEESLKVENLPQTTINKVPHSPQWCIGIISVRGVIIPVVDMHIVLQKQLADSSLENSKKYLLLIEHDNHAPIILQIDKLPEIVNIKDYTYSTAIKNSPNWQGKTWENSTNKLFEVDHDKLFSIIKS